MLKKGRLDCRKIIGGIIGIGSIFFLISGVTSCAETQPTLGGQTKATSLNRDSGTGQHAADTGTNGNGSNRSSISSTVLSANAVNHSVSASSAGSATSIASAAGPVVSVVVSKEVDGDTIHVKMPDGSDKTIRMLLIDTPEDVKPHTPVEPFSLQAAAFAKAELPVGKHILIEEGKTGHTLDKYGRLLAYIYITKTDMYNEDVVRKGLARVAYIYPPNTNHLANLEADEQYAKSHKLGIWSLPGYVTSYGYNMSAVGSSSTSHTSTKSGTSSAAASGGLKIVSSHLSVSDGDYASVTVETKPQARGTIEVDYKSGKSTARGLAPQNADSEGDITWKWKIGSSTSHGNWPVIVSAAGKTIRLALHVS
jgi:micrococcal nuclease